MLPRVKTALYLLPLALVVAGCSEDEPATTATTDSGDFEGGPITTRPDDGVDTGTAVTDTGTAMDSSMGETATETGGETGAETGGDAGIPTVTLTSTNQFLPNTITIKAGQKVRWVWAGGVHSVVSGAACVPDNKFCNPSDTSCATAPTATTGNTYEHTFPTAGTFPYFCQPHCTVGMTGTVIVAP
jgi:plastocyanin